MLPYEDELQKKLTSYNKLKSELEEINKQIKVIKSQIDKWMKLNNLKYFEKEDLLGQSWQLDYQQRTNRKTNWDFIKRKIDPSEHHELVIESKSDPFLTIRPIKYNKKKRPDREKVDDKSPFEQPDVPTGEVQ